MAFAYQIVVEPVLLVAAWQRYPNTAWRSEFQVIVEVCLERREPFLLRLIDCLSSRSRAVSALLI
ncbi:hypothetical protein ACLOJK_026546 [Asimina triloba]